METNKKKNSLNKESLPNNENSMKEGNFSQEEGSAEKEKKPPKERDAWINDEHLGRVSRRNIDRIETLFRVEKRAVSLRHIVLTLMIDIRSVRRVVEAMLKHGIIERIETNSGNFYRLANSDNKPN